METLLDRRKYRREEIVVNIGYRQCGIGSNSCGPALSPEYSLLDKSYSYAFRLLPFWEQNS